MHLFHLDLHRHEQTRLAAVLQAVGDTVDPGQVLADEQAAHTALYADLDLQQQATYDELVAAGVLGARPGG